MMDVTCGARTLRSPCGFSPAEGRREIHHQDGKRSQAGVGEAITRRPVTVRSL